MRVWIQMGMRRIAFAGGILLATSSAMAQSSPQHQAPTKPVPPGTYPLSVPTAELVSVMRSMLFADSGRFYPCRLNAACASWGKDVVLTNPNMSVDGPRVILSVHMIGTYELNQFFAPRVSGDLFVSGVPVLRDNKVALTQTATDAGPNSDMAFRAFFEAMHPRIQTMIEQAPGFDLAQYLVLSTADPTLPPPRLANRGCVNASQIKVDSVGTHPSPPSINATVTVNRPTPGPPLC